ncbi:MAG: alpha/beta hydrolase [Haloferula sp.]
MRILGVVWTLGVAPLAQAQQTPFLDSMFDVVVTSDIQYGTGSVGNPSSGQIPLRLDVYQPAGVGLPASLPGFVVIHGGGFTAGSKTAVTIVQLCEAYARRGYVTVSINYRLVGDDPTFEPGPTPGTTAVQRSMNAAAQDAAKALRWLRSNAASYKLDPDRIAIGGSSAGAITSLFSAYQEADTIGTDADVSAILDLWGGMYGAESLVDADDPPVFIVHGTADQTVPVELSEDLVSQLQARGVDYRYYPLEGVGHGPWFRFFNTLVEGKTLDRHGAEFLFKKLELVEIHPRLSASPSLIIDEAADTVSVSVGTDPNFEYQLFSSDDLTDWDPAHPDPVAGDGNPLEMIMESIGSHGFFRWLIVPAF